MYKTILVFLLLQWGALFAGTQGVCADFHFVTLQFPPLEYENDRHEADGAVVEIVRTIMANLGYTVDIRVLPWTRAMRMVSGGKADAIFTAYKNADREQFLDYSEEVLLDQEIYFYKKRGSSFDFDGRIASIRDARIGIVSTISYGQAFDRYRRFIRLDKANQLTHNLQKLAKGRVDLLPSTYYVAEYTIKQMGMEKQVERIPQMIESLPSYIAFSKKRDLHLLRGQFDEELKKLKTTGRYSQILQKHGMTN